MSRRDCMRSTLSLLAITINLAMGSADLQAQQQIQNRQTLIGLSFLDDEQGPVAVRNVERGSVAAEMGLRPGDVIVSVNGNAVADSVALGQMLKQIEPGKPLTITVRRDGRIENKRVDIPESSVNLFGATLNADTAGRIVISEVPPNTPAGKAGLASGDIVLTVAGQRHASLSELSNFVAKLLTADRGDKAAEPVKLTVQRPGEPKPVELVIEREPASAAPASGAPVPVRNLPEPPARQLAFGVEVLQRGTQVEIRRLMERGPAALAGMMPGDVIAAVDKRPVQSYAELVAIASNLKPGDVVPVNIVRGGEAGVVEVRVVRGKPGSDDIVLAGSDGRPSATDSAAPSSLQEELRDLRARVLALEEIVARLVREQSAPQR